MVFPRDAAPAAENSRIKFSRQAEKASANFSGAKIRSAHFPAGGIFVSGLAGKRPRAQRFPAACTFLFGTNRPKSPVYIQQPQRPTRQSPNAFFCSFGFQDAKTRGAYFFSIQSHRFRLGRPISPAANPITTSNKTTHSLPAPAGQHLPPPFFSYRPTQSSTNQLPSSRLGRPTPYIPSYHFFNIHKASSSHQVSLPTILLKSTNKNLSKTSSRRISVIFPDITTHHSTHLLFSIFPFSISSPTSSRPSSFRTSNSNLIPHFPNALHFFRPAAASPTRRPNAKRSFARGCSLQGCRWCGRGARVSFFSFFFYFFLLLSFLYPFSSPWRRGFAATPSFFFLLLFLFLFFLFFFLLLFLLFSFCFFLFIFLLIFYSCFFFALSFCFFFLFIFALIFVSLFFIFIFVLLLSLPSLFFLFVFLLSFYLCFSFSFLSFFLFYFFTLLTPISFLIIQPLADHSFFLFRRQSFPFHPATSRQQQK